MEGILQRLNNFLNGPEIAIFHKFQKPPYGGGNQFLLALEKELERRDKDVGRNKIGSRTKVCLFNSFHFDFGQLSSLQKRFHPKMIHRVDGPVSLYRGVDQEIDQNIWNMNSKLANQTIFQSQYSLDKYLELGFEFKNPSVIPNAADPEIFNKKGRISPPDRSRKIKLVAMSWSANRRKGASFYEHLDKNLDYSRFEFTFLGNCSYKFINAIHIAPLPSEGVANNLKNQDIYITASENDPCSNALIEALTCGLPAVFLQSGGHPELVKSGGESFVSESDLIPVIEKVSSNYKLYQDNIDILALEEVANRYLKVFNS